MLVYMVPSAVKYSPSGRRRRTSLAASRRGQRLPPHPIRMSTSMGPQPRGSQPGGLCPEDGTARTLPEPDWEDAMEQARKLVTEIPGPRSSELLARREAAVPPAVFNTVPVFAKAASGSIVEDVDGNRLIDLGAGLAVLNTGNTPTEVVGAIQDQAEVYTHTCFHVVMHEPYVEVAERLNDITPGDHAKKTMLANSGAEAVENAVKLARYHTGRP